MKSIEAYKAKDGSLYETKKECIEHNILEKIGELLRNESRLFNTPVLAKDILKWFKKNHKDLSALLEVKQEESKRKKKIQ